jgi:hypothetical protein
MRVRRAQRVSGCARGPRSRHAPFAQHVEASHDCGDAASEERPGKRHISRARDVYKNVARELAVAPHNAAPRARRAIPLRGLARVN